MTFAEYEDAVREQAEQAEQEPADDRSLLQRSEVPPEELTEAEKTA